MAVAAALRLASTSFAPAPARRALKATGGLSLLAASLALGSLASAQQAPAPAPAANAPATLEEVTVTGSRIKRTTDFSTPNPTTVVDSSFMENLGLVNVAEAVTQLPANVSTNTPASTGNAGFFIGSTIANLRGLNPYFGSRTLTMMNNRRFVPTNQGDGVDLNFIPSILIDRIDIVTGGGSAAYGSGAIAGVENIFLNTKLEGGKLTGDFYQSSHSDARDKHFGAAYGHGFADGRGHFVVGGEYQNQDSLGCFAVRSWCAQGVDLYASAAANSQPYRLGSNVRATQINYNGVFGTGNAAANTTLQATPDGQGTMSFGLGQQPFTTFGFPRQRNAPGGDGYSAFQFTNLLAPVKRGVGTGTFTFDLTDSLKFSADGSWGKVETTNFAGGATDTADFITPQNAFIQGNPALTAAVGTGAFLNKNWTLQTNSFSKFTTTVKRFSVGLDGKFGSSSWTWDAYYQFGDTAREQLVNDNRHLNGYLMATDSVVVNGVAQCRVTAAGGAAAAAAQYLALYGKPAPYAAVASTPNGDIIAAGCQPLNPFGVQQVNSGAYNYAWGRLDETLSYRQQVTAANASGDIFDGIGAGPFQAAVGGEFRTELGHNDELTQIPDAIRRDFSTQYGEAFAGKVSVWEAYLEGNFPLLKDKPAAKSLEVDIAGRESHYDNAGLTGTSGQEFKHNLTAFKFSGIWEPLDWLRFRGSQSRDMRAANFRELYYGQVISAGGTFGFCGPGQGDPCEFDLHGNVNLNPEKADTTTAGIVLTPRDAISGFEFAVDYFKIRIKDAILQASTPNVLNGCKAGNQAYCDQITFDSRGQAFFQAGPNNYNVQTITAYAFNGAGYLYKGLDFTTNYLFAFKNDATLNTRILATRMFKQDVQTVQNGPFVNVVGETGASQSFVSDYQPAPLWTANVTTTYATGPWTATGQMRWVDHGIVDHLGVTPDNPLYAAVVAGTDPTVVAKGLHAMATNYVPNYFVFNLSGSYKIDSLWGSKSFEIFGTVNNVLNKRPPLVPGITAFGINGGQGGTNAVYYDTIGLAYRIGFRTQF